MSDPYQACTELLREADKDRYLASLFVPQAERQHLHALYAFDIEIARVAGRVREPMAGEIRFQWWRDVLAGERAEEAAANPLAAALVETLAQTGLARSTLDSLIDARVRELYHDPVMTRAELGAYAWDTDGAILRLAAATLTGQQEVMFAAAAEPAAEASTIAWSLLQLPAHASRRLTFIPEDLLQQHGVDREDIFAGRMTPALVAALADMRAWARARLAQFRPAHAVLDEKARPAFLHVWLLPGVLDAMQRPGFDPFRTRIEVPQWRRQWRLWRASRG